MNAIISVLLFGFVHSGSKLIMQTGISLLSFCLLYSGIRLLVQVPYVFRHQLYLVSSRKKIFLLLAMGLIGAVLQLTEFHGIRAGVSVGVTTFLIYSYPVWTTILSVLINQEKIRSSAWIQVAMALIGIALIVNNQLIEMRFSIELIFPLVASFLMALWISLSNLAKKREINSWSISFYYDLFSFVTLLVVFYTYRSTLEWSELKNWLTEGMHFFYMVLYSVVFGLVPNILFYNASKNISAVGASFLLMFEPVISAILSMLIWQDSLGLNFWLGALFVLCANVPVLFLIKKIYRKLGFYEKNIQV